MGSVSIPLHSHKYPGLFALIDAKDYPLVSQYRWHPRKAKIGWYAATDKPKEREKKHTITITLHKLLMGTMGGMYVDHISGDGLDCRRSNMRWATSRQNAQNRAKRRNSGNPFKGIRYNKVARRWQACIKYDGKYHTSRRYSRPEDAALAYDEMAMKFFGEFARVNFTVPIQLSLPLPPSRQYPNAAGVYFDRSKNRWKAEITRDHQRYRLGSFREREDAMKAYQQKRKELSQDLFP